MAALDRLLRDAWAEWWRRVNRETRIGVGIVALLGAFTFALLR